MGLGCFAGVDAIVPGDAMVYAAPMPHGCGLCAIAHPMAGARHVVPQSGGVDAAELFAPGRSLGPLSTFAAPTVVKRLAGHVEAAGGSGRADAGRLRGSVYS